MSTTSSKCVTQVKLELKEVIENLNLLENSQISDEHHLEDIKQKIEQLLKNLESKPLESIRSTLNKRQRKRKLKKLQKSQHREKQQIQDNTSIAIKTNPKQKPSISHVTTKPLERSRMYHHHLRSLYECQRFLKTFELLEQLHLARGQDPSKTRKFSDKLQHLKFVWNSLLQEQQSEQSNNEQQIQQQWNQVLFGVAEKTFFEGKPNLKYFLRKRHIWDSYIDNKYGTSIPIGWVSPPLKPTDEWSQYLAK